MTLLIRLMNSCTQHSRQVMESDSNDDDEMVEGPLAQDEFGPGVHTTKCRLCEKNNQL